jgi:hypothetical protein
MKILKIGGDMNRASVIQIIVIGFLLVVALLFSRYAGYLDNVLTLALGLLVWTLATALLRKLGVAV